MNRSTISRLKSRKAKEPGDEVPQRRTGSGRQRKHGMKELIAVLAPRGALEKYCDIL